MSGTATQRILLIDDDPVVTEALALLLERAGRTTIVCADLESAEVFLLRREVTHVVTDVQFSGDFGFEGLHSLERMRALRPGCRIILMTGFATDALREQALAHGAAAVIAKPFEVEELEAALGEGPSDAGGSEYEIVAVPAIDEILRGGILDVAYQPIIELSASRRAIAFEALTRMHGAWSAAGPSELFGYAARRGRLTELNLLAMRQAIESSAHLPPHSLLFINVDPIAFADDAVAALLARAASRGVALDRVVLEITERSAFPEGAAPARAVEAVRELGVRFALDDHGSAWSHLANIHRLRPSFIKISSMFGTAFEADETKRRIVRNVASLARDFGAQTVLEGIECAATADAAAEAGIDYAQGFHFGRPSAASSWRLGVPRAA